MTASQLHHIAQQATKAIAANCTALGTTLEASTLTNLEATIYDTVAQDVQIFCCSKCATRAQGQIYG